MEVDEQEPLITLDYCCEEAPEASLWGSVQERHSWVTEVSQVQTLPGVCFALRALMFAMQPHVEL